MTLLELLECVKDEHLGKDMLEKYSADLTHVHTKICYELADIEKKEAKYLAVKPDGISHVSHKWLWKATDDGQRQIDLENWLKAVVKEISSIKSRLYSIY